jgi:SAM-dependent methyltransferase
MILTDLQRLAIADNTFDFVFCLHVLEHVADDRQGITEMWRILKPGGVAYLMVPFMLGWEKTVEFGKPDPMMFDHVRGYSPNDFHDRLKPFRYEEIFPENFLTPDEVQQYRIPRDSQVIYRCEKQPEEGSSGKRSDPSR